MMSVVSGSLAMIYETRQAYLLHHQPSGDSSQWLTLLSREAGLLKLRYQGGRSLKKSGSVQLFTPLILSLERRPQSLWLKQIELGPIPPLLTGERLICAWYLNELLLLSLKPQEPCPDLFDAYQSSLLALHQAESPVQRETALRRFELSLLDNQGLRPDFTHCADGQPIIAGKNYQFKAGCGFIAAEGGWPGAIILDLPQLKEGQRSILKKIMRKAIAHLLDGKPIKSRDLFRAPQIHSS